MTGTDYRRLIARYVTAVYGERGLVIYEEVGAGLSIIGKQRRLDLLLVQPSTNRAMAIECKYQDSIGTADEKIPYALSDLEQLGFPGVISYAGAGFSEGVLHMLKSAAKAAYCLPDPSLSSLPRGRGDAIDCGTWQLDHLLAIRFGWWDVLIGDKRPVPFALGSGGGS